MGEPSSVSNDLSDTGLIATGWKSSFRPQLRSTSEPSRTCSIHRIQIRQIVIPGIKRSIKYVKLLRSDYRQQGIAGNYLQITNSTAVKMTMQRLAPSANIAKWKTICLKRDPLFNGVF